MRIEFILNDTKGFNKNNWEKLEKINKNIRVGITNQYNAKDQAEKTGHTLLLNCSSFVVAEKNDRVFVIDENVKPFNNAVDITENWIEIVKEENSLEKWQEFEA